MFKKSRSCFIEERNLVLMSFDFENEQSSKAVETWIVSKDESRLPIVGWQREAIESF